MTPPPFARSPPPISLTGREEKGRQPKLRPTQKPTIDDIGKGTDSPMGGLIEEPSRDGLGMDLFGLATDDGGESDESGVLMGNDWGAADHPADHRPVVDSRR